MLQTFALGFLAITLLALIIGAGNLGLAVHAGRTGRHAGSMKVFKASVLVFVVFGLASAGLGATDLLIKHFTPAPVIGSDQPAAEADGTETGENGETPLAADEIPEEDYLPVIDLTRAEIDELFGQFDRHLRKDSMPTMAGVRVALTGYSDAVNLPLWANYEDTKDYVNNHSIMIVNPTSEEVAKLQQELAELIQKWKEAVAASDEFEQAYYRNQVYELVLRNPVCGDMLAQGLAEEEVITKNNPDVIEFAEWLDANYTADSADGTKPVGVALSLQFDPEHPKDYSHLMTTDKYYIGAAKLCIVLEYFVDEGVAENMTSIAHWQLTAQSDANLVRTVKNDDPKDQENRPVYLMSYTGKSGNTYLLIGFNRDDGRLEKFSVEQPKPASNPKPETTPEPEPTPTPTPKNHTLTINYVFSYGGKAAEPHVETLAEGAGYNVTSPTIAHHTADQLVVSGTMGKKDITVTVTYTPDTIPQHNLRVEYKYKDGSKAAEPHTETLAEGAYYNVSSPTIANHTPDQAVVAGQMGTQDILVVVTYTKDEIIVVKHNLLIHYVFENGDTAAPDYDSDYAEGAYYGVPSPVIKNHTPSLGLVQGTMGKKDVEATVVYYPDQVVKDHNLTIYYQFTDGSQAAPTYSNRYNEGASFNVTSPTVDGHTASRKVVDGVMGNRDIVETVVYTPNATPKHNLTIDYVFADGGTAAATHTETLAEGAGYYVPSPSINKHTPDKTVVSGTMGSDDVYVKVTYTKDAVPQHTLTIYYVYSYGGTAAATHTEVLAEGAGYNVGSPSIEKHTVDQATVSGTMGNQDITVTVTYTPEGGKDSGESGVNDPENDNDQGGGVNENPGPGEGGQNPGTEERTDNSEESQKQEDEKKKQDEQQQEAADNNGEDSTTHDDNEHKGDDWSSEDAKEDEWTDNGNGNNGNPNSEPVNTGTVVIVDEEDTDAAKSRSGEVVESGEELAPVVQAEEANDPEIAEEASSGTAEEAEDDKKTTEQSESDPKGEAQDLSREREQGEAKAEEPSEGSGAADGEAGDGEVAGEEIAIPD